MIKAFLLIFYPVSAWDRVIQAQRSTIAVVAIFLLPLLGLTSLAEGYGLVTWGEWQGGVNYLKHFPVNEAVAFEIGQLVLSIGIVFIGAWMIKGMGDTFRGQHTFRQSFTVVAYGLSPLFTMRLLDAFPISPWVGWTAGILLSAGVLYHGVPRVMMPDPPNAFGLYLMSTLLLAIATGLMRFVTAWYLEGKFKSIESVINHLTSSVSS